MAIKITRIQITDALDLLALPPQTRRYVELVYLEGKPVPEIAEEGGVAPKTVRNALSEFRRAIRERGKEQGEELSLPPPPVDENEDLYSEPADYVGPPRGESDDARNLKFCHENRGYEKRGPSGEERPAIGRRVAIETYLTAVREVRSGELEAES